MRTPLRSRNAGSNSMKLAATVTGVTGTWSDEVTANQVITIIGANGKSIDVTFAWIRNNDGVVGLVTSIPTPR